MTMTPSIDSIRDMLASFSPERLPDPDEVWQRASVAMIFAGDPEAPHLAFILRAHRESDRWSGQMALPGGRASAEDADHVQVAVRETREEIGLDIQGAELLGELSEVALHHHGSSFYGVLSILLFYIGEAFPPFTLEESEVAAAYWIPIENLQDASRRTSIDWELGDRTITLPGISHEGQIIWGLTYRVLQHFYELHGLPDALAEFPDFER